MSGPQGTGVCPCLSFLSALTAGHQHWPQFFQLDSQFSWLEISQIFQLFYGFPVRPDLSPLPHSLALDIVGLVSVRLINFQKHTGCKNILMVHCSQMPLVKEWIGFALPSPFFALSMPSSLLSVLQASSSPAPSTPSPPMTWDRITCYTSVKGHFKDEWQ